MNWMDSRMLLTDHLQLHVEHGCYELFSHRHFIEYWAGHFC